MVLVVESHIVRVEFEELSHLVRDVRSHLLVSSILYPNLQEAFLRSQGHT